VFHYYAHLSGVFGQETYHDNEDFTQKTIFVLVSESSLLMAPDIALIMVLMGAGCVEVFNAALSKIENVPSVYIPFNQTVVDRGKMSSRFMKINEYVPNKASLASMNRASGMLDITGGL
jgi:hypothetical protein